MFQFTHPGRGATFCSLVRLSASMGFNSRTPGGVRLLSKPFICAPWLFQFTHPGRGATAIIEGCHSCHVVSIHAPREGCDLMFSHVGSTNRRFNSRTPGGVRPTTQVVGIWDLIRFNSRTPGGVRPNMRRTSERICTVSIHAPREGCDSPKPLPSPRLQSFNSRTPGGVRLIAKVRRESRATFQFTHPGRGATVHYHSTLLFVTVSIHAPREGCDIILIAKSLTPRVSIHAPREGCD